MEVGRVTHEVRSGLIYSPTQVLYWARKVFCDRKMRFLGESGKKKKNGMAAQTTYL